LQALFRCRGAPKRAGFLSSECSNGFYRKRCAEPSLLCTTSCLSPSRRRRLCWSSCSRDSRRPRGDTSNNCAPGDDSTAPDDENVVRTKSTPCIGSASDARSKLPHLQDQTFADCFLVCDCLQHDGFCEGVYHNQTPSCKLMIELVSRQAVRDILTPRH